MTEGIAALTGKKAPDDPFSADRYRQWTAAAGEAPFLPSEETLYVSPSGHGAGTKGDPADLQAAIRSAGPGGRIVLLDGIYEPGTPYVILPDHRPDPMHGIRLEAEHPGKAVLDGGALAEDMALMILAGRYWTVSGIAFRHSPKSGLIVSGSGNTVSDCEAYENGDTGILIISQPDAGREDWPVYNTVRECISHDNCDPAGRGADGFGVRLRAGAGNLFYRCAAYHNIDDGFDLYSEKMYGPIGPVELDHCLAYANGRLSGDPPARIQEGAGTGFRLGGEDAPVCHEVWNCEAYDNNRAGFFFRHEPGPLLHGCNAFGNGPSGKKDYAFREGMPGMISGDMLSREPVGTFRKENRPDGMKERLPAETAGKNILILTSSIGGGGSERVACRLASELCRRHRVILLYFNEKEDCYPISDGVTVVSFGRVRRKESSRLPRLARRYLLYREKIGTIVSIRKKERIDTTISLLPGSNRYNIRAGGGTFKIVSERNDPSRKSGDYQKKIRKACAKADYVVFQSERVRKQFPESIQKKSCVIHNPVGIDRIAGTARRKKIVTFGRLVGQKNHAMLIRAFRRFRLSHPEHHLYIYGKGPLLEALQELARASGLEPYVHFEGFSEDVCGSAHDAEMFVLSSDYEGLSNALMEAMKMGLPCVSTDCTGTEELLADGWNGLVVPVGDEEAMSEAMCRIADDPGLQKKLGSNAMLRATEFEPANIIRQWERILG